jgi:hypothetical protein
MTSRMFRKSARWVNIPTGVLIALLQRSPALKAVAALGEYVLASPAGSILKGAFAAAASLGAVNSLAGATTLSATTNSPASATVNTAFSVAFTVLGTTSDPESWTVSGTVPPGLLFYSTATGGNGVATGTVNASTLYLRGTPTTAGNYSVSLRANDSAGFMSPIFTYTINVTSGGATPTPPSISSHPVSLTVAPGGTATFSVAASGTNVTYQWMKGATAVAGATSPTLTLPSVGAADAGDYSVVVSNSAGSATSRMARLVVDTPQPGKLKNMSVRSVAGTNGAPLIVGMVMSGGSKTVLIRAIGPGLAQFPGVGTVLQDPKMDVMDGSTAVATNDNWATGGATTLSNAFAMVGAFALNDTASKDAAILTSINGARTVHVNAATGNPGVVLVEAYDAGAGESPRLINVSARNRVGTGGDILIAGFVIDGNVPRRVLIRGVGPRIGEAPFNVPGVLADPRLELYAMVNGQPVLAATNDNWGDEANSNEMNALTPGLTLNNGSKDAALLVTLPAGAFTALLSGVNNTTGEGVIEVYDVTN